MASVYSMRVECVAFEPFDVWDEERAEHVGHGCVHFLPAGGEGAFLTLSREQPMRRGRGQYVGPVTIGVDGAEAEGGIVLAELTRGSLRLVLDANAAASIEDDEVRVGFEVDDAGFAELRERLAEILADAGVLRVQEAGPGAAPDPAS